MSMKQQTINIPVMEHAWDKGPDMLQYTVEKGSFAQLVDDAFYKAMGHDHNLKEQFRRAVARRLADHILECSAMEFEESFDFDTNRTMMIAQVQFLRPKE